MCLAPRIRELDLADNLLPSWSEATQLAHELPKLASLDLSLNCMAWPPARPAPEAVAPFMSLHTLVLNQCCLSWLEVRATASVAYLHLARFTSKCSCNTIWILRWHHGQIIVKVALRAARILVMRTLG